jgi:hypothetical protein
MDRRPTRSTLDTELRNLERELAALRLRVATIRNHANTTTPPAISASVERVPTTGDRVRFNIIGQGYADGVIIRVTPKRVLIRQDRTGNVLSRAPHNVTLI